MGLNKGGKDWAKTRGKGKRNIYKLKKPKILRWRIERKEHLGDDRRGRLASSPWVYLGG